MDLVGNHTPSRGPRRGGGIPQAQGSSWRSQRFVGQITISSEKRNAGDTGKMGSLAGLKTSGGYIKPVRNQDSTLKMLVHRLACS